MGGPARVAHFFGRCMTDRDDIQSVLSSAFARPGLHHLAALFQQVDNAETFAVFRDEGLPRLLREFDLQINDPTQKPMDLLFVLKIFALYRTVEGFERITRAVRMPFHPENPFWTIVFGAVDRGHPLRLRLANELRDPLPKGEIGAAYLSLCNDISRGGEIFRHPFDTAAGTSLLKTWLSSRDPSHVAARNAADAMPFLKEPAIAQLLPLAMEHPDGHVQLSGAVAAALNGIEAGVEFLAACCLDPTRARMASAYLHELGRADAIPPHTPGL